MRVNTMGVYDAKRGKYRRIWDVHSVGRADIIACMNGKYVEVEVKVGKDKQSENQAMHEEIVKHCGGVYILAECHDASDLPVIYNKLYDVVKTEKTKGEKK